MFEIEIHDIKWHRIKFGKPENPAIIFLHGFMGSSEDWQPIINRFSNSHYCIAYDLPGHGNSSVESHNEFYGIENTISSLKRELEKNEINDFVLVGYSMGGRIALSFAIKYPELIRKLVLVSASPGIESASLREVRIKVDNEIAEKIESMDMHSFLKLWYSAPIFVGINQTSLFGKLISRREYNNKQCLIKSLEYAGTGRMTPLWDEIKTFNKPVMLISGERDIKYGLIHDKMQELFPNSVSYIIKDSAHIVHLEQPKEFEHRLRNFIN